MNFTTRVGYCVNFNSSDTAYGIRFLSIPNFDSNEEKKDIHI